MAELDPLGTALMEGGKGRVVYQRSNKYEWNQGALNQFIYYSNLTTLLQQQPNAVVPKTGANFIHRKYEIK